MLSPLVAGQLDHTALGRKRSAEDRQATGRLQRSVDRDDDVLTGRRGRGGGNFRDRPAVDVRRAPVDPVSGDELALDEAEPARLVEMRGGVATARLEVG